MMAVNADDGNFEAADVNLRELQEVRHLLIAAGMWAYTKDNQQ